MTSVTHDTPRLPLGLAGTGEVTGSRLRSGLGFAAISAVSFGAAGRLVDSLPPDHSAPAATVTDPRLVELCFQTAGVLEIATTAAMALPSHIDRLVLRSRLEAATGPVQALVHPTGDGGFDAAVVDGDGNVLLELGGYRTIELPGGLDDELVAPLRDGMATAT